MLIEKRIATSSNVLARTSSSFAGFTHADRKNRRKPFSDSSGRCARIPRRSERGRRAFVLLLFRLVAPEEGRELGLDVGMRFAGGREGRRRNRGLGAGA